MPASGGGTIAEVSDPNNIVCQVKLLWASKTYGDLFWHQQIAELCAANPGRFSVETVLSREQREGSLHGRCTPAVLAAVFDEAWGITAGGPNAGARDDVRFLTVGTKPMMRECEGMLGQLGYSVPGVHALLG